MSPGFVTLGAGDEERLDVFLRRHAESSMFLRSNARAAGLEDSGELYAGTYVAAIGPRGIEGVAAHYWNGIVVLQAPEHLSAVVQAAVARSGRHVAGLAGPWAQVLRAREALAMVDREVTRASPEVLYVLSLEALGTPEMLSSGDAVCSVPDEGAIDAAVEMRVAYCVETLGLENGPVLRENARAELGRMVERKSTFVLRYGDDVVSVCGFNARLPDCVQLGGVFTPVALRSRGFGRAVVAGALGLAREGGVERAVLFTEDDNAPARRAYEALGFRAIGDYGLCLFRLDTV